MQLGVLCKLSLRQRQGYPAFRGLRAGGQSRPGRVNRLQHHIGASGKLRHIRPPPVTPLPLRRLGENKRPERLAVGQGEHRHGLLSGAQGEGKGK